MPTSVCRPTSTMCHDAGTFSAGSVLYSAPWVTSLATTTSVGQDELHAPLLGRGHDPPGVLDAVRLDQALADGLALGQEEGVGHPAADDEDVDLAACRFSRTSILSRDLGPADDRGERPRGDPRRAGDRYSISRSMRKPA